MTHKQKVILMQTVSPGGDEADLLRSSRGKSFCSSREEDGEYEPVEPARLYSLYLEERNNVNLASPFHEFSSEILHVQLEKLKSEAFMAKLGQLPFLYDKNRK